MRVNVEPTGNEVKTRKARKRLRHDNGHTEEVVTNTEIIVESLKCVGREYCMEASICGLKRLVDKTRSIAERVIWIVIMVISLACSAVLVKLTFSQFENAPLVTTQLPDGVAVSSIVFPTISVCTTNRISKAKVTKFAETLIENDRNEGRNISEMLVLLYNLGHLYDLEPNNIEELMTLHRLLDGYDIRELLSNLTPDCSKVLVRCVWETQWLNCSKLFDFRLTMNGFCCTFNYLRESDQFVETGKTIDMYNYGNKSRFGYDMGLKVLLYLDDSDDFYSNVPLLGAQITITDAYDFPDAASGSLRLQMMVPETQMSVYLTASVTEASRDIQHVAVDQRGCLFYDESPYLPIYTNSDCLLKCRVLFIKDKCGCIPFNVPEMNGTRTCRLQDVPCLHNYTGQSVAVQPPTPVPDPELEMDLVGGGIPCPMCYPTCSKTIFTLRSEGVMLYPHFLNEVPDSERKPWAHGVNFTMVSAFHIKYADERASAYGQNIVMKWFDIVSNIGSTCGFVTGFSFVSLVEFLYFFTFKLYRKIRSYQRPQLRNIPEDEDLTGPPAQIYWEELKGPNSKTFTITGSYKNYNS